MRSTMPEADSEALALGVLIASALVAVVGLVVDVTPVAWAPLLFGVISAFLGFAHACSVGAQANLRRSITLPLGLLAAINARRAALLLVTGTAAIGATLIGGGVGTDVQRVDGVPHLSIHGGGPVITEARYHRERMRGARTLATVGWFISALAAVLLWQSRWPTDEDTWSVLGWFRGHLPYD